MTSALQVGLRQPAGYAWRRGLDHFPPPTCGERQGLFVGLLAQADLAAIAAGLKGRDAIIAAAPTSALRAFADSITATIERSTLKDTTLRTLREIGFIAA